MELPKIMQVQEELERLLKFVKGKRLILEIGTAQGGTLYHFLKYAHPCAEVVSIDLPDGPFGGEYGQPEESDMQSWCQPGQKLHIIRADSRAPETVAKVKEILAGRKFDFELIDGDHTYEGVKGDFETYAPLGEDVVVFHDIAPTINEKVGVGKFWQELKGCKIEIIHDRYQGWAGIGVLRLRSSKIRSWLDNMCHPMTVLEPMLRRHFVRLHGEGDLYQADLYRCVACGRLATWRKIRSGDVCCGGKVRPTVPKVTEVIRLNLLPWTV